MVSFKEGINLHDASVCDVVPANCQTWILTDPKVDVVVETRWTAEEVAGRSETFDKLVAVRALRVLTHSICSALTN